MALNCAAADAAFGPLADPACRAQDFTLYFEQAIFALVPAAVFSVVFPARISVLAKAKTAARPSNLRSAKLVSESVQMAFHGADLGSARCLYRCCLGTRTRHHMESKHHLQDASSHRGNHSQSFRGTSNDCLVVD